MLVLPPAVLETRDMNLRLIVIVFAAIDGEYLTCHIGLLRYDEVSSFG